MSDVVRPEVVVELAEKLIQELRDIGDYISDLVVSNDQVVDVLQKLLPDPKEEDP